MLLHILLYASGVERNVMCSSEDVDHLAVIIVTHMYKILLNVYKNYHVLTPWLVCTSILWA